jgi:hypothetical protein
MTCGFEVHEVTACMGVMHICEREGQVAFLCLVGDLYLIHCEFMDQEMDLKL